MKLKDIAAILLMGFFIGGCLSAIAAILGYYQVVNLTTSGLCFIVFIIFKARA